MRITKVSSLTPTVRETDVYERTDALVVALYPKHLTIRLKGRREAVAVDYDEVLKLARRLNYKPSLPKGA